MHPIELLRYLARSGEHDPQFLIPQAADALGAVAHDQKLLVMGCKKLIEYHPTCGPLWWLCTRALNDSDPHEALDNAVRSFESDPTNLHVSLALSDSNRHVPICVAHMATARGVVVDQWNVGRFDSDQPIWVIAGIGVVVDTRIARDLPLIPLDHIDRVIGPNGVSGPEVRFGQPDAPYLASLASSMG